MAIFQAGQLNVAALQVAGVYVQIVPPQLLLNGVATNVVGLVGTAAWGPVNAPAPAGNYASYAAQFGDMQARKYDAGTHVWAAYQQGAAAVLQVVRVTDGTDTAASVNVQSSAIVATSKWTGSKGNLQQLQIGPGAAANSIRASVLTPGSLPEVFDNILKGVQTLTPTPGTTYTSVPALNIPAPASGVQATANASLAVYGTPTIGAGGTGYVANDFITLPNGVVVKVNAVSGGVITSLFVISTSGCNVGSVTGAGTPIPTNPVAQVSTTGIGTGATVNLTWGVGPATITNPGSGYTSAPAPVLTGGGTGSGGAYTAAVAYWGNIVSAINNGQGGLRGPSQGIVLTNGVSTAAPTTANYTLAGGTDGASVSSASLVGVDSLPRTGLYALRGRGCSVIDLADCDDTATFSTQISFGLTEGAYMIGVTPASDTLSNAASELATAGIDSYAMKVMFGDWVYMLDTINNQTRLVSPQGFVAGLLGNLAPNQSSLNKPIQGIVGTQKSYTGVSYTNADLQTLVNGRVDVIANPSPGGTYFSCQNGHSSSSNASIRQDSYTRMTNFLATTMAAGMGIYVGQLQSADQRRRAKSTLDSFFQNLWSAGLIGNAQGTQPWQITLDDTNNPPTMVALGIEQAYCKVQYLSVIEELVISLEGGQTVTIQRNTQPVTG